MRRIALLRTQGMPSVVATVQGFTGLGGKQASEVRRQAAKVTTDEFGEHAKLVVPPSATAATAPQLLRAITTATPRNLKWRDMRPYLLAQSMAFEAGEGGDVLSVSGYLRGTPLDVNQLVHVPGVGARRILRVTAAEDPCPMKRSRTAFGACTNAGARWQILSRHSPSI